MKNLNWRGDRRRWLFSYYDGAGERRQHVLPPEYTRKMQREAQQYVEGWLAKQKVDGAPPKRGRGAPGPTVADIWEKWLAMREKERREGKPRYKASTIADNRSHLKTWILPTFSDVRIQSLDTPSLRAWIRKVASENSSSYTRNVYSTFRSLVDAAMGEEWVVLPANPLTHPAVVRELPEARRSSGERPIFIELEHAQKLIASPSVPPRRRVRYLVDLCTGMSEGELAGRRWRDAELGDRPWIEVVDACATRGEEGWASVTSTKTRHRVRRIPLHSAATEALKWWKAVGWVEYVGRQPRPDDPIFPGPGGGFSRPATAALLRTDLRAAGCPETMHGANITAQAMRRCFSTYLDDAGVRDEVRGRLMGHAAATVTAKHYTAAQLETDREAIEKIQLWWGPRGEEQHRGTPERLTCVGGRHTHAEAAE